MWNYIYRYLQKYENSKMVGDDKAYTFKEIASLAIMHGMKIREKTIPNVKCIILCKDNLYAAIAILACWKAQIVPVPLSVNYGQKHSQKAIELINPDIIITDYSLHDLALPVYNIKSHSFLGKEKNIIAEKGMENVAVIMCTSGTTGKPKGVMISNEALWKNIYSISKYFVLTEQDRILISRPLYHCAVLTGEFLISIVKGTSIYFFSGLFEPFTVKRKLFSNDITVMCGTPTLLYYISQLLLKDKKETHILTIALSGECLNEQAAKVIRAAFPNAFIYNVYGLTEAGPRVSYLPPKEFDKFPGSVGIPIYGVKIKIVDNVSYEELKPGEKGLIWVKSPSLMMGYYRNEELTEDTIVDGWLNTKDIGYVNNKGYLFILGRSDNMIIKAGMNIYPKEIEEELIKLKEIKEVLAYGCSTEKGEDIAVDIVLEENAKGIDKKDIMERFSESLPSYLMPKHINIKNSLERNASGKIIRPRR